MNPHISTLNRYFSLIIIALICFCNYSNDAVATTSLSSEFKLNIKNETLLVLDIFRQAPNGQPSLVQSIAGGAAFAGTVQEKEQWMVKDQNSGMVLQKFVTSSQKSNIVISMDNLRSMSNKNQVSLTVKNKNSFDVLIYTIDTRGKLRADGSVKAQKMAVKNTTGSQCLIMRHALTKKVIGMFITSDAPTQTYAFGGKGNTGTVVNSNKKSSSGGPFGKIRGAGNKNTNQPTTTSNTNQANANQPATTGRTRGSNTNTKPPTDNTNTKPTGNTNTKPPTGNTNTKPAGKPNTKPTGNTNTKPPTGNTNTKPAGKPNTKPTGNTNTKPPTGNTNTKPAGKPNTKPTGNTNTKPPTGDTNTKPAGNTNTKPPTGNTNTKPPTGNTNTKPPTGNTNTKPAGKPNTKPTGNTNTKPPTGNTNTKPPTGNTNTKPPTGNTNTKPPTGNTNTKPPTGNTNTKPASNPNLPPKPTTTEENMEVQIFEMVNAHRKKMGLQPFKYHPVIRKYSHQHSVYMKSKGKISHDDFKTRMGKMSPEVGGAIMRGENVAMQFSAKGAFDAWLASPGHRANIEKPEFTHAALGVVAKGNGAYYLTHIFIKK